MKVTRDGFLWLRVYERLDLRCSATLPWNIAEYKGSRIKGPVCKDETVGKTREVGKMGERELVFVVGVNDNDNDTLRKSPTSVNEGSALQARVLGS